ncbi:MAG: hypothetical protein QXV85_09725 [Candidatus Bathyarchaeia archaeon]
MHRKAISSTLVIILFVVATLVAAAAVVALFASMQFPSPSYNVAATISIVKISRESSGTYVYIYNYGDKADSVARVYVDGIEASAQMYNLDGVQVSSIQPNQLCKILIGDRNIQITNKMDLIMASGNVVQYTVGK